MTPSTPSLAQQLTTSERCGSAVGMPGRTRIAHQRSPLPISSSAGRKRFRGSLQDVLLQERKRTISTFVWIRRGVKRCAVLPLTQRLTHDRPLHVT
jgi:hypothetical protein